MEEQFHRTQFNDEMTVKHPALGTEWRLDVINEQTPFKPIIGFKLKRLVPGEFLFMLAKDYMVPPEDVVSAEQLVSEVYPQSYARRFAKVEIDAVREVDDGRWEADYRFMHDTMGLILKRERVKIVRTHVLLQAIIDRLETCRRMGRTVATSVPSPEEGEIVRPTDRWRI